MNLNTRWKTVTPIRVVLLALGLLFPLHLPRSLGSAADAEKQLGWWAVPRGETSGGGLIVVRTLWHASNTGLVPGDVVLELNGAPATVERLQNFRADARPGQIATLTILRRDQPQVIRVPVRESSPSYAGYRWYRVALATLAWLVGMALIGWRGQTPEALLLGGALLLVGPVTLPVAFAHDSLALTIANDIWHVAGGIYRFVLPMLLLFFFLRHSTRRPLARSPWVTAVLVAATFILALVTSSGFREPLAWSTPGFAVQARAVAGLIGELLAIGGMFWIAVDLRSTAQPIRWVAFASFLVLGSGAALSVAMIGFPGSTISIDALRQIKALALALLPIAAALYMWLTPVHTAPGSWQARVRASAALSGLLSLLYGCAVAGAAAITLSIFGLSLRGAELSLFSAIIVATIVFAPVLQWSRQLVDRHVFSDWISIEQKAHALVEQLHGELQPHRIADQVQEGLPHILDVRAPALVLRSDLVSDWYANSDVLVSHAPRAELELMLAKHHPGAGSEPVRRDSGELIGVLHFRLLRDDAALAPPERRALATVVRGIAVALRNSEAYFDLQKANQVLSENERVTSLAVMAGGLAHEIKNPLASLKMGLYLLRRESSDHQRLQRIEGDVRRIDDLVSSLLRFTHSAAPEQRHPIDLHDAVRTIVADLATLARDRDIRIVEIYEADALAVVASASELRVMVSSVLHNALDASPSGSEVTIRISSRDDMAEISIHDQGPGIPAELRRRVFEMNFSTKQGGSGLGLALARREAERLGGRIELNTNGQGTTMNFLLPAARPAVAGEYA